MSGSFQWRKPLAVPASALLALIGVSTFLLFLFRVAIRLVLRSRIGGVVVSSSSDEIRGVQCLEGSCVVDADWLITSIVCRCQPLSKLPRIVCLTLCCFASSKSLNARIISHGRNSFVAGIRLRISLCSSRLFIRWS